MNLRGILKLLLIACICSPVFSQVDTTTITPEVTSITINWTWQAEDGDTISRDFCLLEFALPPEYFSNAYSLSLESFSVADDKGRAYQANAFAVTAGEQSLHRNYRLLDPQEGKDPLPRFRVRIESPNKDIEYFRMEGQLEVVRRAEGPGSVQEFSTLDWQSLYEALLPYDIQLVFAAQSRSLIEQMANLGDMSPEGQASLNEFLEAFSMYLHEPLYPENSNLLLDDPHKRVLKIEILGPEGQPILYQDRRTYAAGALLIEQQYQSPLSGQERVRVYLATDKNRVTMPIRMERVVLPW
ncbi:MAG: hypothetical protein J5I94_18970 [Phaeodactylibacter sp.]|nr:hypothetical protein [Phaeodactylibacter sp.]